MKSILFSLLLVGFFGYFNETRAQSKFEFPELPYGYDALELFIDKTTMEIHYSRHHRAYFNNFVKAVDDNKLQGKTMEEIFAKTSTLPLVIRNHGGGYYNHNLFWEIMSPSGGGKPEGKLMKAIEESFGSFEDFAETFQKAANSQFGSGWAWLSVDRNGKLFVSSTPNQDNPLMDVVEKRGTPILGLDVWEHAYYLQYQNKRGDYVSNFWKVVNWKKVSELYATALK